MGIELTKRLKKSHVQGSDDIPHPAELDLLANCVLAQNFPWHQTNQRANVMVVHEGLAQVAAQ